MRWIAVLAVTLSALPASAALAARSAPAATIIVVSPDGAGSSCSQAEPCTLASGQAAARALAPIMQSDIDVVLEGGTYQVRHAIRLGPSDSGTHGFAVVYRAAAGARPVISGAHAITGWHRVPGTSNTWSASVPRGFDTRQLYVDGHRLPMATGLPAGTTFLQTATGLTATSTAMASWPDATSAQVVFRGGNGPWTQTSCPITAVGGTGITVAQPCWDNMHLKALGVQELAWVDDPMGGFGGLAMWKSPTAIENAAELLTPGHWSIDHVRHTISYEPTGNRRPAGQSIVAPAVQTLLKVAGNHAHPVHDVTIEGITFSYAGWTATDSRNGFPQMQADWYLVGADANDSEGTCRYSKPTGSCPFASWTRTPANVVLTSTRRVHVVGDTFRHLGGAGLDIYDGSRHDLVEGNEFSDISASGIQLGSTDDALPPAGHAALESFNTISDNYLHNVANQYLGGIGIWLGYTQHSLISHNQIDDVPYTGISVGWGGWHGTLAEPDRDPNSNAYNVVANNLISNYMSTLGDGGAIYTNGSQATSWPTALHITDNVAYNGKNTDFSLYTDAASQYVDIARNFVFDQPFDSFASGGCRTVGHIRLDDNYFSQGGPIYPCFPHTDVATTKTTTVCEIPDPSEAPTNIARHAGLDPAYRQLVDRHGPRIDLVGPTHLDVAGGPVLITGSGFAKGAAVRFGGKDALSVKVLSDAFILAKAPPGSGTVPVTVTTRYGTARGAHGGSLAYTANPGPCLDYVGTGITTKLFLG
ncbi:MAG TPA: right-handed parallel beta-helix repeat-containing protein [Mycobacteriales bacterium]|nr:right-handed parallel beta-helix repeat-containing protein [Mycobacteriales bacterium]